MSITNANLYKMSSNLDSHTEESPTPNPKDRKPKRQTNRKKRANSEFDENTLTKGTHERQMLLTKFCKKNNNSSLETTTTISDDFLSINSARLILEEELKKKDEMIQKLQCDSKFEQQKNSKLRQEFLEYSQKTRQSIIESKKEIAAIRRKQKGEIIPKFGYFRDQSGNNFVQGEYLSSIKAKITQIEKSILQFEVDKPSKAAEERQILVSRIQFNRKQLTQLKEQLIIRQKEINTYKQQLKLYNKEHDCIFSKDSWPLLKNRYQPLQLIGSGGFGQVYKGFDIQKYQEIAIKIHSPDNKHSPQNYQAYIRYLNRQIKIHRQLEHPNIVKMIDQLQLEGNRIGFIMQYCTGPELRSYLRKQGCLDERQAKFIIKQLIYAIKYLHEQKYKIVHYDLKPANILFHNGMIKIVDFGISKIIESEDSRIDLTSPGVGTYWYLPPEVFQERNAKISSKVDVWSIGVIFYEMLYGKKPFGNGLSQSKILSTGAILQADHVNFPAASPKNYRISQQAKSFIKSCLEYYPDKRLSPLQAYEHDYIN